MTKLAASGVIYRSMAFTVERYHAMIDAGVLGPEDKVELLHGQIVPMSPVGRLHAACVSRLSTYFIRQFSDQYTCRTQDPITILPESEPEPDFVVTKYDEDSYAAGHPAPSDIELLIEVSDSTLDKDRTYKLPLYAANLVREYWIVNLVERQFEVYTKPDGVSMYRDTNIYLEGRKFTHPVFGPIDTSRLFPPVLFNRKD
jgi:Uma2 family endonuclease